MDTEKIEGVFTFDSEMPPVVIATEVIQMAVKVKMSPHKLLSCIFETLSIVAAMSMKREVDFSKSIDALLDTAVPIVKKQAKQYHDTMNSIEEMVKRSPSMMTEQSTTIN